MHGRKLAGSRMSRHRAQLSLMLLTGSKQRLTQDASATVLFTWAQLSNCSDGSLCPRTHDDVNSTCCDRDEGRKAGLGLNIIDPSLLNSIRSTSPNEQQSVSTTQPTATPAATSTVPSSHTSMSSSEMTSTTATPTASPSTTPDKGGLSQGNKMYANLPSSPPYTERLA